MKSYLNVFALAALMALAPKLYAQCSVSDVIISNIVRTDNGSGACTLSFDLDFTMQNNNGNKTIVLHLWPENTYPVPALDYSTKAPGGTQLAGSYGTIVINNDINAPAYMSTYPFGTGVSILPTDPAIGRTGGAGTNPYQFHISGVTVPNVNCLDGFSIKGDIWSTNAGSLNVSTKPHCWTQDILVKVGDPTLSGVYKNCTNPRSLNFTISTHSISPITVSYHIYRDDNTQVGSDKTFNPSFDTEVTLPGTQPVTISATQPFIGTSIGFTGNNVTGEHSNYWVVVSYMATATTEVNIAQMSSNQCAGPLPVRFSSFTAKRKDQKVLVEWTTEVEADNRGFYVQRRQGDKEWKNISFVFSQADGGNSAEALRYTFTDQNNYNGLSQYRIQQIDMDYTARYSEIELVRGESSDADILVYPNPSRDGKVTVVFEKTSSGKNLVITDISGRTVKTLANIQSNHVVIDQLVPGFYTIQVTDPVTGATTVEKIIVKKDHR